jgi:hypothetical protein
MSKKTNPKRRPATGADVKRARDAGMNFGVEFGINCILHILLDKHDAPEEDIMQLRDEFMYLMDSIEKGYVTYADIRQSLRRENNLEVVMR